MSEVTEQIVEVIITDLMDRRSLKVPFLELEEEDPELFARLKIELAEKVERVLRGEL